MAWKVRTFADYGASRSWPVMGTVTAAAPAALLPTVLLVAVRFVVGSGAVCSLVRTARASLVVTWSMTFVKGRIVVTSTVLVQCVGLSGCVRRMGVRGQQPDGKQAGDDWRTHPEGKFQAATLAQRRMMKEAIEAEKGDRKLRDLTLVTEDDFCV